MMDLREDKKMSKGFPSSLSVEEASGMRNSGIEVPLKKGPWTSAEDAILVEYVKKHGEGNWNCVQKHSGLARCGKSCRLRWANHLRPDLKKGAFTPEEEQLIIELHAKFGNKWARMAAELPGRTDNEIKNFWNTRIKKMQRAGLPIYPADVCMRVLHKENHNMATIVDPDKQHHDQLLVDNSDIPEVQFKSLELQGLFNYSPAALDVPETSMQFVDSTHSYNPMLKSLHPPKRLRESDTFYHYLDGSVSNIIPLSNQYEDYTGENLLEPLGSFSPSDAYVDTTQLSHFSNPPGSHAFSNGNDSSSEPISVAMKSELPSLQYLETRHGSWGTPTSPLLSLDSVDTFIQSPQTEHSESDPISPQCSGLLEAIIYESRGVKESNRRSSQPIPGSTMPSSAENSSFKSSQKESNEHRDPSSPLGHSAASVLSEHTPAVRICFVDEPQSIEATQVKEDPSCYVKKKEKSTIDLTRPDVLLDVGWFGHKNKDQRILSDAIEALEGEDFRV